LQLRGELGNRVNNLFSLIASVFESVVDILNTYILLLRIELINKETYLIINTRLHKRVKHNVVLVRIIGKATIAIQQEIVYVVAIANLIGLLVNELSLSAEIE
jgi:hypothetical protein